MRKIIGLFVIAGLLAVASVAAAQESQPAPSAVSQGPTYEQFQANIARMPQVWVTQLTTRLDLDVQQQQVALKLLRQRTDKFLQDNGQAMFDVVTRGQEMARLVGQSNGDWSVIPEDTRKQMAEKGAAMMDQVAKEASDFADQLRPVLRAEQQQKLDEDRARIQQRMDEGKAKLQALAKGEAPPEPAAPVAGQADAAPAGPAAKAQAFTGGPGNPDNWESYVRTFIASHKLDEVQKVQAMDILKKYQEKAKALPPVEAAPAAASGPAPDAAARLAAQRRPMLALFNQMRAELDQIPTPVQKQLAGMGTTSAPSSRPAALPAAAAAAQTQPQAK
jgi:hypothetical protein